MEFFVINGRYFVEQNENQIKFEDRQRVPIFTIHDMSFKGFFKIIEKCFLRQTCALRRKIDCERSDYLYLLRESQLQWGGGIMEHLLFTPVMTQKREISRF